MTGARGHPSSRKRPARSEREPPAADLSEDRARALALTPVSRETLARLDRLVALLQTWQRRTNLIAPSTEGTLWTRHIADSLQLIDLAPAAKTWVDLGSGAGFPGVIIACALAETGGGRVHLVESNAKKAAFLREVVRETGAPAQVHNVRIAEFLEDPRESVEIVTARALAPLAELFSSAYPFLQRGARGIFPKGQDVEAELTEAARCWNIEASLAPSRTDPHGRIVVVTAVQPAFQS